MARLEEAIREEEDNQSVDVSKKRARDSLDENDGSSKTRVVDKFRGFGLKQLREEATRRGLSSTGTKKELLERLCDDADSLDGKPDSIRTFLSLF